MDYTTSIAKSLSYSLLLHLMIFFPCYRYHNMARYIIIFCKNIKIDYEYKYNNNIQNKITTDYNM